MFKTDDVLIVDSKSLKKAYFTVVQGVSQHGEYWLLDAGDYNPYEASPKEIEKISIAVGHKNSFNVPNNVPSWIEWNLGTSFEYRTTGASIRCIKD